MKAIVLFGSNGKFDYCADWKMPAVPNGWALVKTAFCGVCGSDVPRFAEKGSYHHPMVLGHEFSGTVEIPGDSGRFCEGDHVAVLPIMPCGVCEGCRRYGPFHCVHYQFIGSRNDGGFAEYCAVPESNLMRLPDCMDLRYGALLEPLLVALHAVRRSGFQPGQSAVVFGAGPIGLLIGQWLMFFRAGRVVQADIRPFSLDIAKRCGMETLDCSQKGLELPQGVDHAFEASGAAASVRNAITALRERGTFTVVGRNTGDTVIPLDSFEKLMRKELDLKGCWGYDPDGEEQLVSQMMQERQHAFEPLITHVVPVERGVQAIRDIIERKIAYCKVLISFA
ncbi:MAG: alcohol dehydrogenase catalytic domain-containing protein [Clostridia bacterium]